MKKRERVWMVSHTEDKVRRFFLSDVDSSWFTCRGRAGGSVADGGRAVLTGDGLLIRGGRAPRH